MFKVFPDIKSGGNFHHKLGPRSGLSRMLPTTISADWKIINNPDTVGWITKTSMTPF